MVMRTQRLAEETGPSIPASYGGVSTSANRSGSIKAFCVALEKDGILYRAKKRGASTLRNLRVLGDVVLFVDAGVGI